MASSPLAMDSNSRQDGNSIHWGQDKIVDNLEIPKFKSFSPSSISISPSLVSPSNFSPSIFLDSPAFVSTANILASPTTGALICGDANEQMANKGEENNFFDFSFQPRSGPSATTSSNFVSLEQPIKTQEEIWNSAKPTIPNDFSYEKTRVKSDLAQVQSTDTVIQSGSSRYSQTQPSMHLREQRRAEDGYNWRKYGQKQVKGSENPRSYYKCTYPNCPAKKKVERSLDGQITEIVYKGNHNHPKPQSTRRLSSSQSIQTSVFNNFDVSDQSGRILDDNNNGVNQLDPFMTQEDSTSGSMGEDEFDKGSPRMSNLNGEQDGSEPVGKRWKGENESKSVIGGGSKTVREPKIVVQTTSDIDILIDGYNWRKYGQKVVKGNPNPRSYYKCTAIGCPVRKHVERASHDKRAVITTYEGKHNHDVPAERGRGSATNRPLSDPNKSMAPLPIRPSAISSHSNHSNYADSAQRSSQAPYTLEMLQNPVGSFGYPPTNIHTQQHTFDGFSRAKEEPNDDLFFDSFLA